MFVLFVLLLFLLCFLGGILTLFVLFPEFWNVRNKDILSDNDDDATSADNNDNNDDDNKNY